MEAVQVGDDLVGEVAVEDLLDGEEEIAVEAVQVGED